MSHFDQFHSLCVNDPIDYGQKVLPHIPPIYATSTFIYESPDKAMEVFKGNEQAHIYSRWHNPTVDLVEQKIAALENFGLEGQAKGVLFSSGMGAITALLMALQLKQGDTILTQGNLYGTTTDLLNTVVANLGVEVIYANLKDLQQTEDTLKNKQVKLLYIETPANPTIDCYDLANLARLAKKYNAKTAVDNTFATPLLQQPFQFGIDYVVHSATKFLNGHGTALNGIVVGTDIDFIQQQVWKMRKLMGANSNAFDAFLLNNGLKTLALRMERHCQNAQSVAEFLASHQAVSKVNYLGLSPHADHSLAKQQMAAFGGTLSFELKGGLEAGIGLMRNIKFCKLTASLGTVDTLIQHPASMTHIKVPKAQREAYGITDGLIRMSVGIENLTDITNDLDLALN